ncbi:hypothetical protein [Bradyrhizobium ivorense]|uniref:hypothetical protein n=1 Tax=Bradyrhizobium ivorense TaxID=2511166 RepID=UPI001116D034|nr:hypothetical protein [Bradyrhizobium ivorense]
MAIMKHWTTKAMGMATLTLITGAALAGEYNTDKIGGVPRQARRDLPLSCARRGLHDTLLGTKSHNPSIRDVPENSRAAINAVGDNSTECSDFDLRANNFGGVILSHDFNVGGTIDVGAINRVRNHAPTLPRATIRPWRSTPPPTKS